MSAAMPPHPGNQAEALGVALTHLGFTVEVLKAGEHQKHPCVVVTSGPGRIVKATGYVYAAPDEDGSWWFWWSALDPIATVPVAPLSDVCVTADAVARAITRARAIFRRAG